MRSVFSVLSLLMMTFLFIISPANAQDTECAEGTRAIEHELGVACIPETVERVVTLENSMTEAVVTLGVQPVGVADIELYNALVNLPIPLSEDAVDVGSRQEPNLEVIATLEPDLIIAASWRVSENYDALNAIAPTLAFEGSSDMATMSAFFNKIAVALGQEAEAERVLNEMHQYLDTAASAVADSDLANNRIVLSQTWYYNDAATFRLYTDNAFPIEVLTNIGLENAWDGEINEDGFNSVSVETLGDITDVNFLFITDEDSAHFYNESPLWLSLPFVQAGTAYRLNDDLWLFGGPLSVQRLVASVLTTLNVELPSQCEAGLVAFEHALGTSCIPAEPQRVVVLDTGELDNALALGAEIVGGPVVAAEGYQGYLEGQLEGIGDTGGVSEPNLEAILALQPDIILGSKQRHEGIYEQLSQIAPTVLTASLRVPWQENFGIHAAALNKQAEADQLLAEYDAAIADLQAQMGDALGETTISIIRFRPSQVRLYLKSSYIGYILQDVGLPRPASQDEDAFSAEISLEQAQDIDADYIFITGYATDDSDQDTFLESPLWNNLEAVKNNRAIDVDDDTWIAGLGVQAALHVIEDLQSLLVTE